MTRPENTHEHLYELLKGFDTAMLVTHEPSGDLHGRPMAIAELSQDGDTYFATSIDSPKVGEVEKERNCLITFQSSSQYAVVQGLGQIVRDRALIESMWKDTWKVWFPEGKSDPKLCLLKVDAKNVEYWDNIGMQGLKYLFEGLKSVVQKKRPETNQKQNAKVAL